MRLLSLGAIAMDIVLDSTDIPKDDGFALIISEKVLPGGSAANVSVAAKHLGLEVYQTGKIGDDRIGSQFRQTLVEEGVDDRYLVTKKNGTTLHTYVMTAPGGRHSIFANKGDCVGTLLPQELPYGIIESFDVFYNDMFSPKAALWLADQAVKRDRPVIYNMQCVPSFMELCGTTVEEIEQMMKICTVFVSGREGYLELTGEKDYRKAMQIVYEKYKMKDGVICTAGSEGAVWYDGEEYSAPAYQIEAIDTTGAGDCFLGGLIYSYFSQKFGKKEALEFANATAALKCLQSGPRGRSTVEEVTAFRDTEKGL